MPQKKRDCVVSDRVKLNLEFSPQQLQADLEKLQSVDWIDHFVTQNYEGDWSVIPLRGPGPMRPTR